MEYWVGCDDWVEVGSSILHSKGKIILLHLSSLVVETMDTSPHLTCLL